MAKEISNDELAAIIKDSFQEFEDGVNKQFTTLNKQFTTLKDGQEDIKMKLDNIVYRFEYDELKRDHDEVKRKLQLLEEVVEKALLRKSKVRVR